MPVTASAVLQSPTGRTLLQSGVFVAAFGAVLLVGAVAVVWSSVEVVDAHETKALTVGGEFRTVLEPGVNFVPPFVSETHSIDARTQQLSVTVGDETGWDEGVTVDVFLRVVDPETAFRSTDDHVDAISDLVESTAESVLYRTNVDDTPDDELAARLREATDEAATDVGVRVERVEVGDGKSTAETTEADSTA